MMNRKQIIHRGELINRWIDEDGNIYGPNKSDPLVPRLSNGYLRISLERKSSQGIRFITIKIHRAVALAFVPNPNNYKEVNHINGNKLDNRAINLEWCDRQYQMRHALERGLIANCRAVLVCDVNTNKKILLPSINSAARYVNDILEHNNLKQKRKSIQLCLQAKAKSAYGFTYQYA